MAQKMRPRRRTAIACGQPATGVLEPIVAELSDLGFDVTLMPIKNDFFGTSITVSGLLTGAGIQGNLAGSHFDVIFLPRHMLDTPGKRTLDGWTPGKIKAGLGAEAVFTTSPATVVATLTRP